MVHPITFQVAFPDIFSGFFPLDFGFIYINLQNTALVVHSIPIASLSLLGCGFWCVFFFLEIVLCFCQKRMLKSTFSGFHHTRRRISIFNDKRPSCGAFKWKSTDQTREQSCSLQRGPVKREHLHKVWRGNCWWQHLLPFTSGPIETHSGICRLFW